MRRNNNAITGKHAYTGYAPPRMYSRILKKEVEVSYCKCLSNTIACPYLTSWSLQLHRFNTCPYHFPDMYTGIHRGYELSINGY